MQYNSYVFKWLMKVRSPVTTPDLASGPEMGGRSGFLAFVRSSWWLVRGQRRRVVLLLIVAFISGLLETGLLYLISLVVTSMSSGGDSVRVVLGPLDFATIDQKHALALGLVLLGAVIAMTFPIAVLSAKVTSHALTTARASVVTAYLNATWVSHRSHNESWMQQVAGLYCRQCEQVVQQFVTLISASSALVVLGAGALVIAPLATLVAVALMAVLALSLRPLMTRSRGRALEFSENDRVLVTRIAEAARVHEEVLTFGVSGRVESDLLARISHGSSQLEKVRFYARLSPALFQHSVVLMLIILLGVIEIVGGGDLAPLSVIVLILLRSLAHARQLQTAVHLGIELQPYVDSLEMFVDQLGADERVRSSTEAAEGGNRLEFNHVWFSYGDDVEVLKDVDFAVESGEAVGLVGQSGAGKSTLIRLAMGMIPPTSGQVRLAGMVTNLACNGALAARIALVPQDNKLIRGSVADNVRFFRDGFTQADVQLACQRAQVDDAIIQMLDGYETDIGIGARDLSGGQTQRLGIARALLTSPDFLILDEPTSALDSESEQLVQETLRSLGGQVGMLIIAHRESTISLCDRVFEIRDGVVAQRRQTSPLS